MSYKVDTMSPSFSLAENSSIAVENPAAASESSTVISDKVERIPLQKRWSVRVKTILDLMLTVVIALIVSPILLIIAFFVACDGGPILFAHQRIGRNGRMFPCLKFRTMVTNPDEVLKEAFERDPSLIEEWNTNQKLRSDPRVTRVGRILRSTSLDELPQLFNVLRLEMSLVGPRPIVQNEAARYGTELRYYLMVRPGMTGAWQVSGRSNIGYSERVELDTSYVKNWQLWRDFIILANTIPAVLRRDGAH